MCYKENQSLNVFHTSFQYDIHIFFSSPFICSWSALHKTFTIIDCKTGLHNHALSLYVKNAKIAKAYIFTQIDVLINKLNDLIDDYYYEVVEREELEKKVEETYNKLNLL